MDANDDEDDDGDDDDDDGNDDDAYNDGNAMTIITTMMTMTGKSRVLTF